MRIDTCHGYAHKHTFYRNGKQRVVKLSGNLNVVFTETVNYLKKDFQRIKENYLRRT